MQVDTVEDKVLQLFLKNPNEFFSGEDLAKRLNVSRNAVWKAVNELRKNDYMIESSSVKGYRLTKLSKQLDARQIRHHLPEIWDDLTVQTHEEVTSTNDLAKQLIIEQPNDDILIVSKKQTKGRGRSGRSFYSELDYGVYFSLAVHPGKIAPAQIPLYTIAAATAVMQAVKEELGLELQVKWVNDLFFKQRKVSGILSEAITNLENNMFSTIIIGIGMNLAGSFKEADSSTQKAAGTLYDELPEYFNVNQLLRKFLIEFGKYHENLGEKKFFPPYEKQLLGIGKEVSYEQKKVKHHGTIEGINEHGHLLVKNINGEIAELFGQDIHFSSQQFTQELEENR